MKIYCDMDGVLVDFYGSVYDLFGRHFYSDNEDKQWLKYRDGVLGQKEDFWENLAPMPDYKILWDYLKSFDVYILTALPEWNDKHVVTGKRKWIKKYLDISENKVHIVGRHEKRLYARHEKRNLLIDDAHINIIEFIGSGGKAIHHSDSLSTINMLEKELNGK